MAVMMKTNGRWTVIDSPLEVECSDASAWSVS
jgi:hypothetical protein